MPICVNSQWKIQTQGQPVFPKLFFLAAHFIGGTIHQDPVRNKPLIVHKQMFWATSVLLNRPKVFDIFIRTWFSACYWIYKHLKTFKKCEGNTFNRLSDFREGKKLMCRSRPSFSDWLDQHILLTTSMTCSMEQQLNCLSELSDLWVDIQSS